MQQSDLPRRFPVPFANSAGGSYIREIPTDAVTPTSTDAPASLYDGFPPECFVDLGAGGIPPNGADFNGILNQLSAWARWQAAGGPAIFNSTFASAIGGYPKGATLASTVTAGLFWTSTANNNSTDPDGGSAANWLASMGPGFSFDVSGNWRRVHADGFVEMGGRVATAFSHQITFTLDFPFGGFPTAFLGMNTMTINPTASSDGSTTFQEVSSSKTRITLKMQTVEPPAHDAQGGFRWIARGY